MPKFINRGRAGGRTKEQVWEDEKTAVRLASSGLSNAVIAEEMGLHPNTVRKDLKMAYRRITDCLIIDGTALGVLVTQCDHAASLAFAGYGQASRTVEVRAVGADGKITRESVKERDWYAAASFLGKAIESIRLKSNILGFGGRADMTPVFQFFAKGDTNVAGDVNVAIPPEDVPKLRKHMREARRILGREKVKTVDDARRVLEIHGVKDAPDEDELTGAVLELEGSATEVLEAEDAAQSDAEDTKPGSVRAF